ncbi:MAG: DUF2666 family protein [Candidatus Micrarchaeota archaeon]
MFDMEKDQIVFIAKHKQWISIKKLLIDEYAKSEDISLILSQIQKGANEKSFSYAEINTEKVEEIAGEYAGGARKGFANLAEILKGIKPGELKGKLLPACKTPQHYPLAEQYFVKCLNEKLGYSPYPTGEILQKVYPKLKIPKPRGNYGKKKKK